MSKLDRRFIALGSGAHDVNLEYVPNGSTRQALTTGTQAISGEKTFAIAPRTTGEITEASQLTTKAYVDNAVENALEGMIWKAPVDYVGETLPEGTEGMRAILTTDNKIYTFTDAWDAGVAPSDNWTVICTPTNEEWMYDDDTSAWVNRLSATVPVATTAVAGKVQISDGIAVTTGVISVDVSTAGGLELTGTSPDKQLGVKLPADGGLSSDSTGLRVKIEAVSPTLIVNGSNELGVRLKSNGFILKDATGIYVDPEKTYEHYEEVVLTATDITNKQAVLTVAANLRQPTHAKVCVVGGPLQRYGSDYIIESDGSYIRRIHWGSLGLDGLLEEGDILQVWYNI